MDYITLNNGVQMPQEGYGVFQITDPDECRRCVTDALACGYRLIDTASAYMIEIHPFFQQQSALHTMNEYHVQPEAWGPLSEGQRDIFHNKLLAKIAWKYHKSVAQIILRWHVQRGVVVIPKSPKKNRMEENIHIWDFQLTQEDMKQIAGMDIGHSEIINHYSSCTAKALNGTKIHD